jgi:hypothetical protein
MTSAPGDAITPSLRSLFATSTAILRRHPVVSAALGGAIVLAIASMLFGIGVVVTPWFVCELVGLQLAVLTEQPTRRSMAWVRAGLLTLGMVGVVAAASWVAAMAIGPDVSTADHAAGPLPWYEAVSRAALIVAVTALTVGFIAPFAYAPLILIERGGTLGLAVLESAWLVRRGGIARHWALVFLAHLLPFAPALIAGAVVARTFERAATPLGVLAGLPLLPFSIPIGLGLVTAAYEQRRAELPERRWAGRDSLAPLALRAVLIAVVLAPMLGVLGLGLGALRPLPPQPGRATGELVLERALEGRARTLHVPDTTLRVELEPTRVRVVARDGGGTDWLAVPTVQGARVFRARGVYAVELSTAEGSRVLEVDRAAVRVNDSIGDRLAHRLPVWALPALVLAFVSSALLLVHALEPLGSLRRAFGAPALRRPPRDELVALRRTALRKAWSLAAVLLPLALLAVAGSLFALLG